MKKRIAVMTVVAAVSGLAAVPQLLAHPHRPSRSAAQELRQGMRPERGAGVIGLVRRFRSELGVTDEQATRIRTILADARERNLAQREDFRKRRRRALDTLLADPSDLATARALLDERAEARRRLQWSRLETTSKALAVLNAEQRAKLSALLSEREERRRGRR